MLTTAAEKVRSWLINIGLKIAAQKSEAIVITQKRKHNDLVIDIDRIKVQASKSLNYMGIQIGIKINFTEHAKLLQLKLEEQ